METAEMGRVVTEAVITNLGDAFEASRGKLPADQVRKVFVPNALVDSGASSLGLPGSLIRQLGLVKQYERRTMTAAGEHMFGVYEAVRVEIMGRKAPVDPFEVPEAAPVLIGQLVLESMDWVIDMKGHRLIGNPAHGGEQMLEVYGFFDPPPG